MLLEFPQPLDSEPPERPAGQVHSTYQISKLGVGTRDRAVSPEMVTKALGHAVEDQ